MTRLGTPLSPTSTDAWFKGTPEAPLVYEHHNPYLFPSWEATRVEAGVVATRSNTSFIMLTAPGAPSDRS